MIKSFSVSNFRNLNVQDLEFGKINLFIGPNNSGKSNFFDALGFLPDLYTSEQVGKKTTFLSEIEKAGWNDLLRRDLKKPNEIAMKWVFRPSENDVTYDLKFQVAEAIEIPWGFYITKETLSCIAEINKKPSLFQFFDCHEEKPGEGKVSIIRQEANSKVEKVQVIEIDKIKSQDIFLNQMQNLLYESEEFRNIYYPAYYPMFQKMRNYLFKYRSYSSNNFLNDEIRKGSDLNLSDVYLDSNGANLANLLANLDDQHFFLDEFTKRMQQLIPDLEKINVVHLHEKKRKIKMKVNGEIFGLDEMSDGTIQAMLLALLLWSPERLNLLLLDEPEVRLHPAWLRVIANWVVLSNSSNQIFINTHSPDFLDMFTESYRAGRVSLFVYSLDAEQTVKRIPAEKLDELFNEGWELGDLYRVGDPNLGGWPW